MKICVYITEPVEARYLFRRVGEIRNTVCEKPKNRLVKYIQSIPELRLVYIFTVVTPVHTHAALKFNITVSPTTPV